MYYLIKIWDFLIRFILHNFFLFLDANYRLQASKMLCLRKQNHRLRSQNLLNGNTPKVPSIPEQEIRQWPETQQLLIPVPEWSLTSIVVPHTLSKKLGTITHFYGSYQFTNPPLHKLCESHYLVWTISGNNWVPEKS